MAFRRIITASSSLSNVEREDTSLSASLCSSCSSRFCFALIIWQWTIAFGMVVSSTWGRRRPRIPLAVLKDLLEIARGEVGALHRHQRLHHPPRLGARVVQRLERCRAHVVAKVLKTPEYRRVLDRVFYYRPENHVHLFHCG